MILIIIFFVVAVAGISWYYVKQALPETPVIEPEKTEESTITLPSTLEENIIVPEITTNTEQTVLEMPTTTPEKEEEVVLTFPSMLLDNSVDTDSDSLSDAEEFIFGTNNAVWDTDGDGYYDGLEIFNLYNPTGLAPMRIIDSGLDKEYVNPVWQYRVYYPAQWAAAAVDPGANQVLLSALSGDYVEIFSDQKSNTESFIDWFGRRAIGQQYSDLQNFTNRFKENCFKRKDDLVAYFVDGNKIYTLIYHPGNSGSIMYRHVMQMIIQSFRPARTMEVLPEQPVLPPEPGSVNGSEVATTTPESNLL